MFMKREFIKKRYHGYTTRNTFLCYILGLPPSIQLLIQITKADNETAVKKVTRQNRDFKIQRRGRQREPQINNRFYKQNNNFACAPNFLICTFLCPFLHDHNVRMPNFAFYGGRNKRRRNSLGSFIREKISRGLLGPRLT